MGEMILIDSNIIIYYLNGILSTRYYLNNNVGRLAVSTITVSEVLSFAMNDDEFTTAKDFLENNFTWLDISREIILKSAEIRREKKIKTPDAIIGATALCHGLALVSRNSKDFKHLSITLINPIDE